MNQKKGWHLAIRTVEIVVGAIASLWLIYVIGVNAVLASHWAHEKINGKPQILQADYSSAYTILPGIFHLKHVRDGDSSRGSSTKDRSITSAST